jgi:acyl-CoA synthetase (NDP forming)
MGQQHSMTLDDIFHPRAIAVVGASGALYNIHTQMFLDSLIDFGFKGEIYPINPRSQEISGLKAYPSITKVPGPVDLVTSLVPARATPQLLRDCVAKGVRAIQLFTAGFAETGEDEGRRLQEKLVSIARTGGVRIIGPNCVGIYCPESRVCYASDFPKEPGQVAFITQSGGYSYLTIRMAAARGVSFSKTVSYGNASDINEIDLLEYLAGDPDTGIIAAYIEGTRDGQRLLRALRDAASKKPVIITKKGSTEAGARGASSHTGALAGDDTIWDVALKQAGVIRVEDVEQMVDLLVTFLFFPLPQGRRAVVLGAGGGAGVRASDECESGGLKLPRIPDELRAELNRHIPLAGSMLRNPVDVLAEPHGDAVWMPILKALDGWDEADMLLWHFSPDMEPLRGEAFQQLIVETRGAMLGSFKGFRKPKAVAVHAVETGIGLAELDAIRDMCREHKVAFYPSLYRAAQAISRYMDYREWRNDLAQS